MIMKMYNHYFALSSFSNIHLKMLQKLTSTQDLLKKAAITVRNSFKFQMNSVISKNSNDFVHWGSNGAYTGLNWNYTSAVVLKCHLETHVQQTRFYTYKHYGLISGITSCNFFMLPFMMYSICIFTNEQGITSEWS